MKFPLFFSYFAPFISLYDPPKVESNLLFWTSKLLLIYIIFRRPDPFNENHWLEMVFYEALMDYSLGLPAIFWFGEDWALGEGILVKANLQLSKVSEIWVRFV